MVLIHDNYFTVNTNGQVGSLFGWRCCLSDTLISVIHLHGGGQIITGRHISDTDTHIMRWEIYYVHLQSGRIAYAIVRWLPGPLQQPLCSGRNLRTNIHRSEQNY